VIAQRRAAFKARQIALLSALRKRGVDPRQVVAHLARLSGLTARDGCEARELLDGFSLPKFRRCAARRGLTHLAY